MAVAWIVPDFIFAPLTGYDREDAAVVVHDQGVRSAAAEQDLRCRAECHAGRLAAVSGIVLGHDRLVARIDHVNFAVGVGPDVSLLPVSPMKAPAPIARKVCTAPVSRTSTCAWVRSASK